MQLLNDEICGNPPGELILAWRSLDADVPVPALTPAERREYMSFRSSLRQKEFKATRGLVRHMAAYLQLNPDIFLIEKDAYGKPAARYGDIRYNLSIAHTADRVLCAIAPDLELGIDIEPVNRIVPEKLRDRVLNEKEAGLVSNYETIRLWTVKEALVKLEGTGLRTNLNDCTITDAADGQFNATFNDDKHAKICSFLHDGYWIAIAWNI